MTEEQFVKLSRMMASIARLRAISPISLDPGINQLQELFKSVLVGMVIAIQTAFSEEEGKRVVAEVEREIGARIDLDLQVFKNPDLAKTLVDYIKVEPTDLRNDSNDT